MNDEQIDHLVKRFIAANEQSTAKIVKETVNGKIDRLTERVAESQSFMENHAKEDKIFQDRSSPMLEIFENNEITRLTIEKKTESWAKLAKEIGIIGAFLLGAAAFIKTYLTH